MIRRDILIAGHSWIELEGEIFDAACYFPVEGCPKIMPVFNGVDLGTMNTSCTTYGLSMNDFLSDDVKLMLNIDATVPRILNGEYENLKDASLWNVLDNICLLAQIDNVIKVTNDAIDTTSLTEKYKDIRWTLCNQTPVPAKSD